MNKIKFNRNLIINIMIIIAIISICAIFATAIPSYTSQIKYLSYGHQDNYELIGYSALWNTIRYISELILLIIFLFLMFFNEIKEINLKKISIAFILIIINLEILTSFFIQIGNIIFPRAEIRIHYGYLIFPPIICVIINIITISLIKQNKTLSNISFILKILFYISSVLILLHIIYSIVISCENISFFNKLINSTDIQESLTLHCKSEISINISYIIKYSIELILVVSFTILFAIKTKNIDKLFLIFLEIFYILYVLYLLLPIILTIIITFSGSLQIDWTAILLLMPFISISTSLTAIMLILYVKPTSIQIK